MIAGLRFRTKHKRVATLSRVDDVCTISYAVEEILRGAGIPFPDLGIDYASVRMFVEDQSLIVTWERSEYHCIEYDTRADRADAIAALLSRSCVGAGIPGLIPESIRFEIEED